MCASMCFLSKITMLYFSFIFSGSEIEKIQELAKQNQLSVIPLVQTFGHFEVGTSDCFHIQSKCLSPYLCTELILLITI